MILKTIATACIALLPVTLLQAQNTPPAKQPAVTPPAAVKSDSQVRPGAAEADAVLATWLVVANNNEVALARLALQKTQSNEVKQFAQKMIDEHGQFSQKLQPFAGSVPMSDHGSGTGGRGTGTSDQGNTERNAGERESGGRQRQPSDASGTRHTEAMGGLDHASLIRDLGKKCLESETKMLNEKSGSEFDCSYMQMQVAAHVKCADMLEVFRTYASDRLRPTLEEGSKTVQAHLAHAKTVCEQCEMAPKGEKSGKIGGDDRK